MGKKQKNDFYISGRVLFVGQPIFYTDKMSKRIIVLEVYVEQYRQEVQFDFVNKNMSLLDNIRQQDWVTIDFVLRGNKRITNEGKARWFTNLEGVAVVKED